QPKFLSGCERRDGCPELLLGRQGLEFVFGRKGWQNLLYAIEPMIEIIETLFEHVVIHGRISWKKTAASGPSS
ncbi:MAG TPA: hypothetical protein VKI43_02595, partial [Vicinamibacterales bacterium]|nr:hypothetical protein [Vicinamibacterales bacterium]